MIKPPPEAVRAVYRCIVRHSNHIQGGHSALSEIRFAFRKKGKLGHLKEAYNLEESLRNVVFGKMSLSQVRERYRTPKLNVEKNQKTNHMVWLKDKQRFWDAYNLPAEGIAKLKVHQLAATANLRKEYFSKTHVKTPLKSLDITLIDTVFAPAWKQRHKLRLHNAAEMRRPSGPRKVSLFRIFRNGKMMSMLRTTGINRMPRGMGNRMKALNRDHDAEIKALKGDIKAGKDPGALIAKLASVKEDLHQDKLELAARHRLLERDQVRLQLMANYKYALKEQRCRLSGKKKVLRLWML